MSNTKANQNRAKYEGIITDFATTMGKSKAPKNLMDMVTHTLKNATKATLADLKELVKDIQSFQSATPAPVEASAKPLKKPAGKSKTESKSAPAKSAKKAAPKANKDVETVPGTTEKGADKYPLAAMFPQTIESEDYGTLVRQDNKFTSWDEVKKALDKDQQVFFAGFWTKRQLREFEYAKTKQVKVPKDGFPNDIDLYLGVLPCQSINRIWAMSIYTEAMTFFEEADLQYVEDNDPRNPEGGTFKVRMSEGMEFEIYVPEK